MRTEQRRLPWAMPYLFILTVALLMPADARWNAERPNVWLSLDSDLWGLGLGSDVLLNVAIFVPVGFALHARLRTWRARPPLQVFIVLLAAGLFSLTIESLQYLLAWRHSSLIDVVSNTLGALGGLLLEARAARTTSRRRPEANPAA